MKATLDHLTRFQNYLPDNPFFQFSDLQLLKLSQLQGEEKIHMNCCPFNESKLIVGSRWYYYNMVLHRVRLIEFTHIRSNVFFFIDVEENTGEEYATFDEIEFLNIEPAVFYAPYPKECYPFYSRLGKTEVIYPELPDFSQFTNNNL